MSIQLVELKSCPVCKSQEGHQQLFELEKFSVFQCLCGHKFIDPSLDGPSQMEIYQSSEHLREINPALENYYEYDTLDPQSLTCKDYDRALHEVASLTAGREMLEVGCGTGSFLQFAQSKGWNVYGVDSSAENILKMQEQGISGTASDYLEFKTDRRFDVIVLWDLIEHPQDPITFVIKSQELLKEDGLLVIATPHDPNLLSYLASAFYRLSGGKIKFPVQQLYILEHTSYFSQKIMKLFLGNGGFHVLKSWKTETDLARYHFSKFMRWALQIAFLFARILNLQNRAIFIAKKIK